MNSNISIVHVGLFLFLSYTGMAQIEGDVTGDNFVDASDYFTLKKIAGIQFVLAGVENFPDIPGR